MQRLILVLCLMILRYEAGTPHCSVQVSGFLSQPLRRRLKSVCILCAICLVRNVLKTNHCTFVVMAGVGPVPM